MFLEYLASCHLAEQCYSIQGVPSSLGLLTGPVTAARTTGRIPTLLAMEEDIRLASVDGCPNPPAPVERRAWAR